MAVCVWLLNEQAAPGVRSLDALPQLPALAVAAVCAPCLFICLRMLDFKAQLPKLDGQQPAAPAPLPVVPGMRRFLPFCLCPTTVTIHRSERVIRGCRSADDPAAAEEEGKPPKAAAPMAEAEPGAAVASAEGSKRGRYSFLAFLLLLCVSGGLLARYCRSPHARTQQIPAVTDGLAPFVVLQLDCISRDGAGRAVPAADGRHAVGRDLAQDLAGRRPVRRNRLRIPGQRSAFYELIAFPCRFSTLS